MLLLLVKLTLTPMLIWAATLAVRRWGPAIGGWLAGLPLTSGPVSVFLALEQGREFAAAAAVASVLGITATSAFCLIYAKSARRFSWAVALPCAYVAYFLLLLIVSFAPLSLPLAIVLAVAAPVATFFAIGQPDTTPVPVPSPWWDVPLRMATAAGILLLITGIAAYIGPKWSGLISPFPVFITVLGVFAHVQSGSAAAHQLMRGTLIGTIAFAAFFSVVALTIEGASLPFVYLLAAIVAVMLNLAALRFVQKRR